MSENGLFGVIDSLREQLGDLLALIHRDGGHHQANVGTEQALIDAKKVLLDWRQSHDELEATQQRDELWTALENCRLLAARHHTEEWASHILRFCSDVGVTGSPLRTAAARKEQSHAMQNIRSANKALAATEADFGQYILCEKEPVAWENPDLYPQIVDHQRRSTDAPLYRARRPE